MNSVWWLLAGVALGVIAMLPVVRLLLRRGERRARQAERRARDAERLAELGSMTSGLAHEIKNPLSTIGLNAQLLSEAIGDADLPHEERDRLRRRVEALSREAERLGGILTDFLQFAGRIKLDPVEHDLARIVDELSDFFHPQCDQHGVTLRTQLPDHPLPVVLDGSLFKQAMLNLMINAVQAMALPGLQGFDSREASRGAEAEGRSKELIVRVEEGEGEARVHVIDTGPGIEPDRLKEIFRPYVSHRSGGTGLGLPTSRRIIEEHGGEIEAHSEPGRGSDFLIRLPLQTPRRRNGEAEQ